MGDTATIIALQKKERPTSLYPYLGIVNFDKKAKKTIELDFLNSTNHPKSPVLAYKKILFNRYLRNWQRETLFTPHASEIIENENFKKIVEMGSSIIPFILKSIENEPSILVWALYFILNIEDDHLLSVDDACEYWVNIGKTNYLI